MVPKGGHSLFPKIYKPVSLNHRRDFADVIKIKILR